MAKIGDRVKTLRAKAEPMIGINIPAGVQGEIINIEPFPLMQGTLIEIKLDRASRRSSGIRQRSAIRHRRRRDGSGLRCDRGLDRNRLRPIAAMRAPPDEIETKEKLKWQTE